MSGPIGRPAAIEILGKQIEKLLNLTAALEMPLSNDIHVKAFRESLPEVTKELRAAYKHLAFEDPWEGQ